LDTIQRLAAALDRQGVGEPLHLDRILDRHLLLGRERERRPVARVLERARLVAVERHLDLDHVVVRLLLGLAGLADALGDARHQRLV
jgi:hypothetical protein